MTAGGPITRGMLALSLAGMLVSCSTGEEGERITQLPQPEQALSEELMIALGQAKNYHHTADVYLSDGKPELAERALWRLLDVPFPEGSPEAEDVRLDARARLAKILLGRGAVDDALDVARAGIEGAERESFFLANLHTIEGEIHEARAEELAEADSSNDGAGAEAARDARRRAIEAYARSIAINERLQERLMTEGSR